MALQRSLFIFLWLTYCKSKVELFDQQKVLEWTVVQEIVVEGPFDEILANENL